MINVPLTVFTVDCFEKLTSHWMGFYRSLGQSKHLIYMLLKWRKHLIRPGRSTRFVVGLKRQMRKSGEVRGPKNARNSRALNHDKKPVVCFCCGRSGHRAKDSSCPAVGKICSNCRKQGHFAGVCKSAPKRVTDSPNIAYQRNANGLRYVTVKIIPTLMTSIFLRLGATWKTTLYK